MKNVYREASLNKIILLKKKIPAAVEPGIQLCSPNYTKIRKVRDLLDQPDSQDEIHIQSLRLLRARVQLMNTEKSEWCCIVGRVRHQDLPLWEPVRRTGPGNKTKSHLDTIRVQLRVNAL